MIIHENDVHEQNVKVCDVCGKDLTYPYLWRFGFSQSSHLHPECARLMAMNLLADLGALRKEIQPVP